MASSKTKEKKNDCAIKRGGEEGMKDRKVRVRVRVRVGVGV